MLIKIFSGSSNTGAKLLNYLFSEKSHQAYKPELIEGNRKLTENIIKNITNKHQYVAGCISFAPDEMLTRKQEKELISHFQKTFAPFKDEQAVNFLWVRHLDKKRLELNFVVPRIAFLKNGSTKAFNIHPPGKANQLFFNTWTRLQNEKYGFKQIDKTEVTPFDLKLSMTVLKDLHEQRKEYISRVFDKPDKKHNNKDYDGRRKTNSTFKQFDPQLRKQPANIIKSSLSSPVRSKRNDEIPANSTRNIAGEQEEFKHISHNFKSNANEIECIFKGRGRLTNGANKSPINTNGLSLEEEIRQLALSLNDCEIGQGASIIAKLNLLQGQLSRQQVPKFK